MLGMFYLLTHQNCRQTQKNDEPNKQSGGLYIIADLCHYISTKGTYTKLNLVRDSFGRKGNHSK